MLSNSRTMLKLKDLTKQLADPDIGLNVRVKELGGTLTRTVDGRGVKYCLTDKDGVIITTSLSSAWHWVCAQHGIG